MKREDARPQACVLQLCCDRCGREAEVDDTDCEFHEFTSVEYTAGYGSIFGDRNKVEIDLCQHCVKETLGPWLRIKEHDDKYWRFDPENHGGEFPQQGSHLIQAAQSHEDVSIQELKDSSREVVVYLKAVLAAGDETEIATVLRRLAAAFGRNK